MSRKNLPAKSRSRSIMPVHTRRLMTKAGPKKVVVNPDVKKKALPVTPPKKAIMTRPRAATPQTSRKKDARIQTNDLSKKSPKLRWQSIMKVDQGIKGLGPSKKEQEEIEAHKRPGERVALRIIDARIGPAFTEGVSARLNIIIINEKGVEETISAKLNAGSTTTNKFVQYLLSLRGKNKKVIFKEPVTKPASEKEMVEALLDPKLREPFTPPNIGDMSQKQNSARSQNKGFDVEVLRGPNGEFMGMVSGTKDLDYVRDYETGVKFEARVPDRQYMRIPQDDGKLTILAIKPGSKMPEQSDYESEQQYKKAMNDFTQKEVISGKTYPNGEIAQQAFLDSANQDTDFAGVPWEEQRNLRPFALEQNLENAEVIGAVPIRTNPLLKQAILFGVPEGIKVIFVDQFDNEIKELTETFGTNTDNAGQMLGAAEMAKKLIADVAENYGEKNFQTEFPSESKDNSLFKQPLNNPFLGEAVIERIRGKLVVQITNDVGEPQKKLNKVVRDLNAAKTYISNLERTYRGK